ncbi:MAG: hypothetical protein H0V52_11570 [Acidimicrobiia bacterium]|nr:hypothetical protein [Acidimicrobiia bacterium]
MSDNDGMNRRRRRRPFALLAVTAALAGTACSGSTDPGSNGPRPGRPAVLDGELGSASLSGPGAVAVADAGLDRAPRYDLRATVEPETGEIDATMVAELPLVANGSPLRFRVFPNLPAFDAGFTLHDVLVDGMAAEADLDRSLLSLDVPSGSDRARVTVELAFSYTVPSTDLTTDLLASFAGNALNPAEIGLLGRHPGGASLGHWFPIWMEPGATAEPEPDGFGDIANFPAAMFSATVDVPDDWEVFTGGKTVDRRDEGGRATYHEEGIGLRDLSIYAGRDVETTVVDVDGVTVRPSVRPTTPRCSLR